MEPSCPQGRLHISSEFLPNELTAITDNYLRVKYQIPNDLDVGIVAKVLMATQPVPVRVQRKRTKGFNLQAASPNGLPVVYIGRPSLWGNPYHLQAACQCTGPGQCPFCCATRAEAVEKFRRKLASWDPEYLARWLEPLRGKNLADWCELTEPCHVDVILEFLRIL